MATLIVPTQYATLALAIAAAASGDTIILEDGVHNVASSISTTLERVKIIARNARSETNAQITCNTHIFNSGSLLHHWEFHDVRFNFGGTASGIQDGGMRASFYRCEMDFRGRTGNSVTTTLPILLTSACRVVVRGCLFLWNNTYIATGHVAVTGTNPTGAVCLIENNVFVGKRLSSSLHALVRVAVASSPTGAVVRIRNNTFTGQTNTTTNTSHIYCTGTFGTGSTLEIMNNVFDAQTGTSSPPNIWVAGNPGSSNTWQIWSNSRFHLNTPGAFVTSVGGSSESDNTTATAQMLDTDYAPLPDNIAFRTGNTLAGAVADFHLRAFHSTPSRGAVEWYPVRARLHIPWVRIPFGGGITMSINSNAVTFPAFEYRSFGSPMEVARALTLLVATNAPAGSPAHGFEAYYTPGFAYLPGLYDGGYYGAISLLPFDLTLSGAAAALLNSASVVASTSAVFGPDSMTVESPYLLDEEPLGEETRSFGEWSDIGAPIAALRGTGGERWLFRFKVVSPPEDPRQTTRTAAERVMGAFHSGRPMRVWRNITDNTPWDLTLNPDGYSDIVPPSGDDSSALPWYDSVRRRFALEIEGVEVRE